MERRPPVRRNSSSSSSAKLRPLVHTVPAAPPMAPCRAIHHRWTLRALVVAYLDLALAYLFLCAASLVCLSSKILAFVGLSLPCSCDGPHQQQEPLQQLRGLAGLQSFLLDYPTGKIAGVSGYGRGNHGRAPQNGNCYDVQLVDDGDDDGGGGAGACGMSEIDQGEESCGSVSKPPATHDSDNLSPAGPEQVNEGESCSNGPRHPVDDKGKAVFCQGKPATVFKRKRRRKNKITIRAKSLCASPSAVVKLGWKGEVAAASPLCASAHPSHVENSAPAPAISGVGDRLSVDQNVLVEEITSPNECQTVDNKALSNGSEEETDEAKIIRQLRKALKKEKSARAALYLELEKERNAAASAADETMAMIFRLQEEKAAIKMEVRQYQRMVEEHSAYAEEETKILKEIIVQRERESNVLERELEAYQQMFLGYESSVKQTPGRQTPGSDLHDPAELIGQDNCSSFGSFGNPELMLREVYESIRRKERLEMQCIDQSEPWMAFARNSSAEFGKGSSLLQMAESLGNSSYGDRSQYNGVEKHQPSVADDGNECNVQEKGMASTEDGKVEIEASVLDVHVTGDKVDLGGEGNVKQVNLPPMGCHWSKSHICGMSKEPSSAGSYSLTEDSDRSLIQLKLNMHRSSSDVAKVGQSMDGSNNRASLLDYRRSSVPSFGSERFKLESEVELLRKRLKVIQQGRERLGFSVEQKEKETYNLLRMEEIAHQLQETRKTTESGKTAYSNALLPSAKGNFCIEYDS